MTPAANWLAARPTLTFAILLAMTLIVFYLDGVPR